MPVCRTYRNNVKQYRYRFARYSFYTEKVTGLDERNESDPNTNPILKHNVNGGVLIG